MPNDKKILEEEAGSERLSNLISVDSNNFLRWSTITLIIILISGVVLAWYIEYPDIVKARASLAAVNAPKDVSVASAGRIHKLFVLNNSYVKKGDRIAYLESVADHDLVLEIERIVDSIKLDTSLFVRMETLKSTNSRSAKLGELEEAYHNLTAAYQTFEKYQANGFFLRKLNMLEADLKLLYKSQENLFLQKDLYIEDLTLADETKKSNKVLLAERIISKQDFSEIEGRILNKKAGIAQIESNIISMDLSIKQKQKEIDEAINSISDQKLFFMQAVELFSTRIKEWKQVNVLVSPIDGKISFRMMLEDKTWISNAGPIAVIIPSNAGYYASVFFSQNSIGKVAQGQAIQFRLSAYPYQEFGYLKGYLSHISEILTDSGYIGQITIDSSLVTSQGRKVSFKNGLNGEVVVIAESRNLLMKMAQSVKPIFKR